MVSLRQVRPVDDDDVVPGPGEQHRGRRAGASGADDDDVVVAALRGHARPPRCGRSRSTSTGLRRPRAGCRVVYAQHGLLAGGGATGRRPCRTRGRARPARSARLRRLRPDQAAYVGGLELLGGRTDEPGVDVDVRCHECLLVSGSLSTGVQPPGARGSGHRSNARQGDAASGRISVRRVSSGDGHQHPSDARQGRPARPRRAPADRGARRAAVTCCCWPARPASARPGCCARCRSCAEAQGFALWTAGAFPQDVELSAGLLLDLGSRHVALRPSRRRRPRAGPWWRTWPT